MVLKIAMLPYVVRSGCPDSTLTLLVESTHSSRHFVCIEVNCSLSIALRCVNSCMDQDVCDLVLDMWWENVVIHSFACMFTIQFLFFFYMFLQIFKCFLICCALKIGHIC